MKKVVFILIPVFFVLCSCNKKPLPKVDLFTYVPVNLEGINSSYDDYNSAFPPGEKWYEQQLVFSTNRKTKGENFDFISAFLQIRHDIEENILIEVRAMIDEPGVGLRSYNPVNTSFDELGPFYWQSIPNDINWGRKYVFLYSNDSLNSQDIRGLVYEECVIPKDNGCADSVYNLDVFNDINTDNNECYPFIEDNILYFSSDREGSYDFFSVEIYGEDLFDSRQMVFSHEIKKIEIISGPSEDKCLFINNDIMVFASDREGGYGGFDLWYSDFTPAGWSEPINFGEDINSEFDEYRPIIIPVERSGNDMMIFSSNRPGGSGGFDLYFVGVKKSD